MHGSITDYNYNYYRSTENNETSFCAKRFKQCKDKCTIAHVMHLYILPCHSTILHMKKQVLDHRQ